MWLPSVITVDMAAMFAKRQRDADRLDRARLKLLSKRLFPFAGEIAASIRHYAPLTFASSVPSANVGDSTSNATSADFNES